MSLIELRANMLVRRSFMEIKIENPQDVLPLMKEFNLPDGIPLYKALKGWTFLDGVQPQKVGNVVFILARKEENGKFRYRIIRYYKTFGDIGIDADFVPESIDEAIKTAFKTLSIHIL